MKRHIGYGYQDEAGRGHGSWYGDRAEALAAGVTALGAEFVDVVVNDDREEVSMYTHRDPVTGAYLTDDEGAMRILGAAILDGRTLDQCYPIWRVYSRPATADEIRDYTSESEWSQKTTTSSVEGA